MNIRKSNPFYLELFNSDMFTDDQKKFIKRTYEKHKQIANQKMIVSMRHSAKIGRPTKIRNKKSFNEILNYYKQGLVGYRTVCRIYGIAKHTFYGYVNKTYVEQEKIVIPFKKDKMKLIEGLYNKYCFEYAENWTNRLLNTQYRDDMFQECLLELWTGIINYYSLGEDEKIGFKAYCNNICENVLNRYIEIQHNNKKTVSYDSYINEKDKTTLEKFLGSEEDYEN